MLSYVVNFRLVEHIVVIHLWLTLNKVFFCLMTDLNLHCSENCFEFSIVASTVIEETLLDVRSTFLVSH